MKGTAPVLLLASTCGFSQNPD
jgi:hypothetical protein